MVVSRDGMKVKDCVKLKGNRTGVTGILSRKLKEKEKSRDLIVIDFDKYKTSRICNSCGTDSLSKQKEVKGCSVLFCDSCETIWQRDVNAAKNMMMISLSVWTGDGRPEVYNRKIKN